MKECCRIYLLRHGEVINPSGAFYSQQDVPLSQKGREQSRIAADLVSQAGISAILSSDLSRCCYMAELLSGLSGISPLLTPDLREVNFGKWTGLSWKEIEAEYPGWFQKRMNDLEGFRPPEGENLKDVQERVMPVIFKAVKKGMGKATAVVAHGGVNRVILASLLGMPLSKIFSIDQSCACVNIIDVFADGIAVVRALNHCLPDLINSLKSCQEVKSTVL